MLKIKKVYAHCDLPCGVYDPEQARIEAESVLNIMKKYDDLNENDKLRAIFIKEQRAELVKHHLWVLWTDYFKPEHLKKVEIYIIFFGVRPSKPVNVKNPLTLRTARSYCL
jgi:nickel-type superoxide dismutase